MAKPTKSQRKALAAMDDAARAATHGERVAKKLAKRPAKKIRALVSDARDASDVSKKALRRKPKRVAKRARKATTRLLVATDKAIDRVEKKAARRADERRMAKDAQRMKAEFADPADFVTLNKAASRSAAADLEPVLSPDAILDPPMEAEPAEDLSALTVAQLRRRAGDAGKTGYSRLTKAQLIDLLS